MVEKGPETVLQPLRQNCKYFSEAVLCEMTLNSAKNKEDVFDIFVSSGKNFINTKETKKANRVWKLFFLVLIGSFSLYMCLIGVDRKMVTFSQVTLDSSYRSSGQCPKNVRLKNSYPEYLPRPITFDRQECACTPVHAFVILSMQRSGSGWFETLLNDHPGISSHGEIFSVKSRRENLTTIIQTLDAVYNLDWFSSAAKSECTAAVGLKWMLNQGVMEYSREISSYFERRGVSVILLVRRNMLKRLISILANAYDRRMKPLNGTHKSHVHSTEEAETLAEYRPVISVKHLLANLRRVQEITDDALHFFNSTRLILVYYEDLVKYPKSIEKVQEFLGVQAKNLASRQVKIHTKPLADQISNWEEVLSRLKGTEFESFSRDDDYL